MLFDNYAPANGGNPEDYKKELQQLSAMFLGGKINGAELQLRMNQIRDNVGESSADEIDGMMAQYTAEGISGVSDIRGERLKAMKGIIGSQLVSTGFDTALGLFQIIDSQMKLKDLEPPEIPNEMQSSPILQDQIAKAIANAEGGDQELRREFEQQVAERRSITRANASATSFGTGDLSARLQSGNVAEAKQRQGFRAEEEQRKQFDERRLDSLLRAELAEKQAIQGDRFRQFGAEERRYIQSIDNLQGQANAGFANLRSGITSAVTTFGQLSAVNNQIAGLETTGVPDAATPDGSGPVEDASGLSTLPTPAEESPTLLPMPEVTSLDLLAPLNPANRNAFSVSQLQRTLSEAGYQVGMMGEYDEATKKAHQEFMSEHFGLGF